MNHFTVHLKLTQHGKSTIYFNKKRNAFSKPQKNELWFGPFTLDKVHGDRSLGNRRRQQPFLQERNMIE